MANQQVINIIKLGDLSLSILNLPFSFFLLFFPISPCYPLIPHHPSDPPGQPAKPTVSDVDRTRLTVNWTIPKTDGGAPILGYYVEKKEKMATRWARVSSHLEQETTMLVTGLREKSEYQFRVMAENKAGVGPVSEPSDSVIAKAPFGKCLVDLTRALLVLFICTEENRS